MRLNIQFYLVYQTERLNHLSNKHVLHSIMAPRSIATDLSRTARLIAETNDRIDLPRE